MASPSIIDVEELLQPISEDQPQGADIREDPSPTSVYYQIKDARNAAAKRNSPFSFWLFICIWIMFTTTVLYYNKHTVLGFTSTASHTTILCLFYCLCFRFFSLLCRTLAREDRPEIYVSKDHNTQEINRSW